METEIRTAIDKLSASIEALSPQCEVKEAELKDMRKQMTKLDAEISKMLAAPSNPIGLVGWITGPVRPDPALLAEKDRIQSEYESFKSDYKKEESALAKMKHNLAQMRKSLGQLEDYKISAETLSYDMESVNNLATGGEGAPNRMEGAKENITDAANHLAEAQAQQALVKEAKELSEAQGPASLAKSKAQACIDNCNRAIKQINFFENKLENAKKSVESITAELTNATDLINTASSF